MQKRYDTIDPTDNNLSQRSKLLATNVQRDHPGSLLLVQQDVDQLLNLPLLQADHLDGRDDGVGIGQLAGSASGSRLASRAFLLLGWLWGN